MPKELDKPTKAYNACVEALSEAEFSLARAASVRSRAWAAAEALCPTSGHGANQSKAEVRVKKDGTVVWR